VPIQPTKHHTTERRGNFRERSRDTISRWKKDAACVATTAAAATVDVSAVSRRVSAMRATITHVIEVARNFAGCTSSACHAAFALRHGAAWRTLRLLRGAGDESCLIAQAVYPVGEHVRINTSARRQASERRRGYARA
jgi:hypothetical protein